MAILPADGEPVALPVHASDGGVAAALYPELPAADRLMEHVALVVTGRPLPVSSSELIPGNECGKKLVVPRYLPGVLQLGPHSFVDLAAAGIIGR